MTDYSLAKLKQFVEVSEEETQFLEFKQTFDINSKDGKRKFSTHITGMANGAGGNIIVGIRTRKENGVDVADELIPIQNINEYSQQLRGAIALFSSPQVENIEFRTVKSENKSTAGYLLIEVPLSERRPHMATASGENRYYRRGLDGTHMMDHQQIKEMMLAQRDAILEPIIKATWTSTSMPNMGVRLEFLLKNAGRTAAKNPFMKIKYEHMLSGAQPTHTSHRRLGNTITYFLHKSPTLHVEETAQFADPKINFCIDTDGVKTKLSEKIKDPWLLPEIWAIGIKASHPVAGMFLLDKNRLQEIRFELTYGAENSAIQIQRVEFNIQDIINKINIENKLRDWGRNQFKTYMF